jgi:hypothetical protein
VNREQRAEQLEQAITDSIAHLEGLMAQGQSEDFIKALSWWSQFRDYSFNNSMLILIQRPNAIQVAGYRKWESLGFQVKKGEKGIFIRGPVLKKVADEVTGEITERLVGYMPLAVFDISQTAEWPEKQPPQPFMPATDAEWEHLYICWSRRLQTLWGIDVTEQDMGSLTYGMASAKTIRINQRHGFEVKAPVLLHELAHIVARHPSKEGHAKWSLQQRELQAEAAAFVLCRMVGGNHPHAAQYLLHYKVEPGQLVEHLEVIGAIVKEVRTMLDFKNLDQEVSLAEPEQERSEAA